MFRTTTLATLSVLVLSGCIETPVSAQYLYGGLHDYSCNHHDHGHRGYYDSHYEYLRGHGDYHGYGPTAYPSAALCRHHAIPGFSDTVCPYGNDTLRSEPIACPLESGRTFPNRLTDDFQSGLGLETPRHNHSHRGHSHEGHSHDGYSHDRQIPSRDVAPSDQGYVAPPSLPRAPTDDFRQQQDFLRERRPQGDSIRIDTPPPPSFGPSATAPSSDSSPRQFNAPPPSTT